MKLKYEDMVLVYRNSKQGKTRQYNNHSKIIIAQYVNSSKLGTRLVVMKELATALSISKPTIGRYRADLAMGKIEDNTSYDICRSDQYKTTIDSEISELRRKIELSKMAKEKHDKTYFEKTEKINNTISDNQNMLELLEFAKAKGLTVPVSSISVKTTVVTA